MQIITKNILINARCTHQITVSETHQEEYTQMIDAVQLFQNSICSLPAMRLVDTLSRLELFATVDPDLGHVNCITNIISTTCYWCLLQES